MGAESARWPGVWALIPALNEEESLPGVLRALVAGGVTQILVVDNGSTDGTAKVAEGLGAQVVREPQRGYGRACLTGLEVLSRLPEPPQVVLFLDGDQSDDPEALPRILEPVCSGRVAMTVGSRMGRGDAPLHQRLGTRLVVALARRLHGLSALDLGPFRGVRWEALQRMAMDDDRWGWTLQMQIRAARLGLPVEGVPVRRRPRAAGRSKISGSLWVSLQVGLRMFVVLWRERGWEPPQPRPSDQGRADKKR